MALRCALPVRGPPALRRISKQLVGEAEKLTGSRPNIFIDVSQVSKLDTFGAWLIERLRRSLTQGGVEAKIAGLSANYSSLVDEVRRVKAAPEAEASSGDHHRPARSGRPQRLRRWRDVWPV